MTNLIIYMIIQTIVAIFAIVMATRNGKMSSSMFNKFREDPKAFGFKFTNGAYMMYDNKFLHAAYSPFEKIIYVYTSKK